MWIRFNQNPLGKQVGDCVVRAISCALEKDWNDTFIELSIKSLELADMPSANSVWGAYLKSKGFARHILPNTCPDCYTVENFCKDHPKGTFVLALNGHVVAIRDGNWYDSWDSKDEVPIYYWRKEE